MEWQKNLYHHEENPPENAWEQISSELDEQPWNLRKNLYDHEVSPPLPAWDNLSAQLNLNPGNPFIEETKVIPFWKKPAAIAAAAVVGGLILFSAYYFLSNKDLIKPSDIATSVIDSPKPGVPKSEKNNTAQTTPIEKEKNSVADQPQKTNNLPKREESVAVSTTEPGFRSKPRFTSHSFAIQSVAQYPKAAFYSNDINRLNTRIKISNKNIAAYQKSMTPPYILVMNENGQPMRVSSKLKDIIYYMPGTDQGFDQVDQSISEINYWKKVFSDWKKKAGNSAFIPDNGNFMDILGLIKMLQENK